MKHLMHMVLAGTLILGQFCPVAAFAQEAQSGEVDGRSRVEYDGHVVSKKKNEFVFSADGLKTTVRNAPASVQYAELYEIKRSEKEPWNWIEQKTGKSESAKAYQLLFFDKNMHPVNTAGAQMDIEADSQARVYSLIRRETLKEHNKEIVKNQTIAMQAKDILVLSRKEDTDEDPKPITGAMVSGIQKEYEYTGKPIMPKPVVKLDGRTLVQGRDYTLLYSSNTAPGTATIVITGKGDYTGTKKITFAIVKAADEVEKVLMHRLYNPNSGEHFYTAADKEKNYLVKIGWTYEGTGWIAPESSKTPVYRLYNKNAGDHHYTMDAREKNYLVKAGWTYEGIGWYSDDDKGVPLYRQYNPNAKAGSHNYTTSKKENDYLATIGWTAEGISWYGMKK